MCGSKLFGGGGSAKVEAPKVEQAAPTPTTVTSSDVSDTSAISQEVERQRKKRGYASTRTSTDRETIAGAAQGKTTLG